MEQLSRLITQRPLVAFHLAAATLALLIGLTVLARRKGTLSHKTLGWIWVGLMALTALSSAFIRSTTMPNIAGYTGIHLFIVFVAVWTPLGILRIRQGRVSAHRRIMLGLFIGAGVLAGSFALMPGRFLGDLLWKQGLGLLA